MKNIDIALFVIRKICQTGKNGSQAANQIFIAFPALKLTTCF